MNKVRIYKELEERVKSNDTFLIDIFRKAVIQLLKENLIKFEQDWKMVTKCMLYNKNLNISEYNALQFFCEQKQWVKYLKMEETLVNSRLLTMVENEQKYKKIDYLLCNMRGLILNKLNIIINEEENIINLHKIKNKENLIGLLGIKQKISTKESIIENEKQLLIKLLKQGIKELNDIENIEEINSVDLKGIRYGNGYTKHKIMLSNRGIIEDNIYLNTEDNYDITSDLDKWLTVLYNELTKRNNYVIGLYRQAVLKWVLKNRENNSINLGLSYKEIENKVGLGNVINLKERLRVEKQKIDKWVSKVEKECKIKIMCLKALISAIIECEENLELIAHEELNIVNYSLLNGSATVLLGEGQDLLRLVSLKYGTNTESMLNKAMEIEMLENECILLKQEMQDRVR